MVFRLTSVVLRFFHKRLRFSVPAVLALRATTGIGADGQVDLARGRPAVFSVAPNYALCTDPEDKLQLTDGRTSSRWKEGGPEDAGSIWVRKGTVGWRNTMPVVITVDLGSVQPISGVLFSTAAGRAGVEAPSSICLATSEDGKTWRAAGDLVTLSKRNAAPPAREYRAFRLVADGLKTKGRYVSFGVVQLPYTFVDEIEVHRGEDAWLAQPASGEVIANMADYVRSSVATSGARRRLSADLAAVRMAVADAALPDGRKREFEARLAAAEKAIETMPSVPPAVKTILPLDGTHRDLLAVYGELLAERGGGGLVVWQRHRYQWLPLLATPAGAGRARLRVSMLRDQFRADSLLLTNASGEARRAELRWEDPPKGAADGWLRVFSAVWTDTAQGVPVADALLPVEWKDGAGSIEIPAGMTGKVWFTVDSSKVPPGSHPGAVVAGGVRVPAAVEVSRKAMGIPRFSLGMWDYTNSEGSRGLRPSNRAAAIALMRSHFVDSPWATSAVLPHPEPARFDAAGNLAGAPDFTRLDRWLSLWPGARRYFVFLSVPGSFAGAEAGTPEFHARVGSWARAISAHLGGSGLRPGQLGLLLVDEPHSDEQDARIAAWAKAINATAPELTLFQDPTWERPDRTKHQDAITEIDLLCPNLPICRRGGEAVRSYFENLRKQGKELWFYQCSGPIRLYDPQRYYRHQPWLAFAAGATGQGFWAFGDTGGAETSWNEYGTSGTSYAPAFLDSGTVHTSVHWEAVREGVEDHEELSMLRDAIASSQDVAWSSRARSALDAAVASVAGAWTGDYEWKDDADAARADEQLELVRKLLAERP